MAEWAYACRACDDPREPTWFVSAMQIAELPAEIGILRVKVGDEWRCAVVDRSRQVAVDGQLLRDACASDAEDCPACATHATEPPSPAPAASTPKASGERVQAAAISLGGERLVVVLVGMDLLASAGEATMAIERLAPRFGGAVVVLMAQHEDGTPRYFGPAPALALLEGLPLEHMPWKEYALG